MKIYVVKTEDGERKNFFTRESAQTYVDWWNAEYYAEFSFDFPEELSGEGLAYITEEQVDGTL